MHSSWTNGAPKQLAKALRFIGGRARKQGCPRPCLPSRLLSACVSTVNVNHLGGLHSTHGAR